jgi:hypothetical protein
MSLRPSLAPASLGATRQAPPHLSAVLRVGLQKSTTLSPSQNLATRVTRHKSFGFPKHACSTGCKVGDEDEKDEKEKEEEDKIYLPFENKLKLNHPNELLPDWLWGTVLAFIGNNLQEDPKRYIERVQKQRLCFGKAIDTLNEDDALRYRRFCLGRLKEMLHEDQEIIELAEKFQESDLKNAFEALPDDSDDVVRQRREEEFKVRSASFVEECKNKLSSQPMEGPSDKGDVVHFTMCFKFDDPRGIRKIHFHFDPVSEKIYQLKAYTINERTRIRARRVDAMQTYAQNIYIRHENVLATAASLPPSQSLQTMSANELQNLIQRAQDWLRSAMNINRAKPYLLFQYTKKQDAALQKLLKPCGGFEYWSDYPEELFTHFE